MVLLEGVVGNYNYEKAKLSYSLKKAHKFFKKCRAIILNDENKLLAIKVVYLDGNKPDEYLLPGGGVDDGETARQAVVREAMEEYNVLVEVEKYLGKNYYFNMQEFNGERFKSNRVEYYYLCRVVETRNFDHMGIDGEFENPEKRYEKVKLSFEDVSKIEPKFLNNVNPKVYEKILKIMSGGN